MCSWKGPQNFATFRLDICSPLDRREDSCETSNLDRVDIHVDLPRRDYGLLPHNDFQLGFDRLGNDIGVYPDDE